MKKEIKKVMKDYQKAIDKIDQKYIVKESVNDIEAKILYEQEFIEKTRK